MSIVHVYASNIRPLYEQEIRDILCAPPGQPKQFRYLKKYIDEPTLADWDKLAGHKVLINFSLQQAAEYHDAVFIPVRTGKVVSTFREGNVYFIDFVLEEYVSLAEAPNPRAKSDVVRSYARYLDDKNVPRPYQFWVGRGLDVLDRGSNAGLDTYSSPSVLFERTVDYLHSTSSFSTTKFFRFLQLVEIGDRKSEQEIGLDLVDGVFNLRSGAAYALRLFHTFPGDVNDVVTFGIDADRSVLEVVGQARFEVSSRYDRVSIPFHTIRPAGNETRNTVIAVEPAGDFAAPRLRLPVRVRPAQGRATAVASGTILALLALGAPAFLSNEYLAAKVALLALGAVATGVLRVYGFGR